MNNKNLRSKRYLLFSWIYKLFLVLILFLSSVSCQSLFKSRDFDKGVVKNLNAYKKGTLSGIVTLFYKKKKHHFMSDIFISDQKNLRIDLSMSLGVPIFTLLINNKSNIMLFFMTKEFYKSKTGSFFSSVFFPKDLDFSIFTQILLDKKPKDPKWLCKVNKKNLPIKCEQQKWKIFWAKKTKKWISVRNPKFKFRFEYLSFSPKVDKAIFDITIPSNFKKMLAVK